MNNILDVVNNYIYDDLLEEIRNKVKYCWSDAIKQSDIEEWLNNFKGKIYDEKSEKILALILLNHFIYFKHEEVLHLCRAIYYEYIHFIAETDANYDEILANTTFCPIGNPSESSSLIMYFFRMANELPKNRFSHYPEKADIKNRVVFIDDISGSGKQASDHIKGCLLHNPNLEKQYISYISLIGTERAKKIFNNMGVEFLPACLLDSRMRIFSKDSYTQFTKQERKILINFISGYKEEVCWNPFGYKKSRLALGFYYNVPDNCLPIFWSEHNNWRSIFKRFHKKYYSDNEGEIFNDRDKFI